jgi:NADH:ubiquinone oxidoreductase subunit 5 (subunit L)/multisubunit Na+/H+ antiporter MnhA subunit
MQRLIAAGVLYLLGTAVILVIRPSLMFTEDGSWKEFGIGRNQNTHTWMPFWFFAILWALTSYILVTLIFTVYFGETRPNPKIRQHYPSIEDIEMPPPVRRGRGKSMELPDGYYIRNTDGTEISGGVPKYIYLGKGLPSD